MEIQSRYSGGAQVIKWKLGCSLDIFLVLLRGLNRAVFKVENKEL